MKNRHQKGYRFFLAAFSESHMLFSESYKCNDFYTGVLGWNVEVKQPRDDKGKYHTGQQEVEKPMPLPEPPSLNREVEWGS